MEKRDIDAPINSYLKKLGKNQWNLQIVSTIEDNYWALFRNLVFATNSDFRSLYLCNTMSYTLDFSNYKFFYIK